MPIDSGASRCQHASASATGRPSAVRYSAIGLPATVRASSPLLVTSWSHATAYQALSGCGKILAVTRPLGISSVTAQTASGTRSATGACSRRRSASTRSPRIRWQIAVCDSQVQAWKAPA